MSALEREIEDTRQRLAATIDQLAHRAHPKTIIGRQVTTVKSHFVDLDSGAPRTDNILKAAGAVVGVIVLFAVVRKVAS
jgi:cobalamin biosynthesis protein CobD/CbiB